MQEMYQITILVEFSVLVQLYTLINNYLVTYICMSTITKWLLMAFMINCCITGAPKACKIL